MHNRFALLELSSLWAFACEMNIFSVHSVFKEHVDAQVGSLKFSSPFPGETQDCRVLVGGSCW